MLAELAAANAAFAIIKQAFQNTGELASAGQALVSYFDNKSSLQKKVNQKGPRSDLEEFLALEQLKKQEVELKEMMIYNGRAGMWQDWLQFQAEAARARREAEQAERRRIAERRAKLYKAFEYTLAALLAAAGLALIVAVIWILKAYGGTYDATTIRPLENLATSPDYFVYGGLLPDMYLVHESAGTK